MILLSNEEYFMRGFYYLMESSLAKYGWAAQPNAVAPPENSGLGGPPLMRYNQDMRLATQAELARWDELVAANPDGGQAMQSYTWGEFKSRWGWHPHRYMYELAGGRLVAAQWLERRIPLIGNIWYCPAGPGVTSYGGLRQVVEQTRVMAGGPAGRRSVFWRLEPEILADDVPPTDLAALGIVRANRDSVPKATILIDLRPGEEELLASFSQTARRNLRKAVAGGVSVEPAEPTGPNLDVMFELMQATDERAHYGLRRRAYYLDYWKAQAQAGQAQLFLARHEGEVLAGIFVTALGRRAWYKDGGSFDVHRELQAPYLLQWEVMRWLKAHGIEKYDLVGVPPRDRLGQGDSKQGLYDFKSKFNPEITEYIGAWDLAPSRVKYVFWRLAGERLAARMANRRPEKWLY